MGDALTARIARALAILAAVPDVPPARMTRGDVAAMYAAHCEASEVLAGDPPSRRGEAAGAAREADHS